MNTPSLKTNAILNIIKQCCSIVFPLIAFPYVFRVLGAEAYGKFSFGLSYTSYFVLLAGLGVNTYAIREGARIREKQKEIKQFADEILTINLFTCLVAYCALFVSFAIWRKLDSYRLLILVQSFTMLLNTIGIDWINSIYEDFKYITIRYICFQVIALILLFLLVKDPDDYIKYAAINVFANAGANILNIAYTRRHYLRPKLIFDKKIFSHIIPMLVLFANTMAVTVYVNSDITLIGIYKTDLDVGIYSAAVKIYSILKQVLNAAIIVVIPRVAFLIGSGDKKEYNNLLKKTINAVMCLMLPCIVGTFLLSNRIIAVIGGEEYIFGAESLRVLCISLCFAVLSCFFTNAILITNKKEKIVLIITLCSASINVLLNLVFIPWIGIVGAAITTVIAEGIVFVSSFFCSRKVSSISYPIKSLLQSVIACLLMGIVVYTIRSVNIELLLSLCICIPVGIITYCGSLILMKNEFAIHGLSMVKKRIRRRK